MAIDFNDLYFFDVETPSIYNDRICSFALVPGNGSQAIAQYIDPEVRFSSRNIGIHGITPDDVRGKPTFKEVWTAPDSKIREIFERKTIVIHNAAFDLSVLFKTLTAYGLEMPIIRYYDTLNMARQLFEGKSCTLDKVCEYLGYRLVSHHDAVSDANAVKFLFQEFQQRLPIEPKFYNGPQGESSKITGENPKEKALNEFKGFLHGVLSDGDPTPKEWEVIKEWLNEKEELVKVDQLLDIHRTIKPLQFSESSYVYKIIEDLEELEFGSVYTFETRLLQTIYGFIHGIIADASISNDDLHELLERLTMVKKGNRLPVFNELERLAKQVLNGEEHLRTEIPRVIQSSLLEFQSDDFALTFDGKMFVATGTLSRVRKKIYEVIQELGGSTSERWVKNTDYLIVGVSKQWSTPFGGNKILKALAAINKGSDIKFITETCLQNAFKGAAK